jgi:hypothetical protein
MAKRKGQKDKQHNFGHCVACPSVLFLLTIVLLVLLSFSFGHGIAGPSIIFFWAFCCLSFCPFSLAIVLDKQQNAQKKMIEGPAIPWPKEKDRRTSNTMVKRKRTEGQATQWPKERGQKDKQHNDQKKRTEGSLSFGHYVACPSVLFFWSLCCFSCHFLLVIVLPVLLSFSFDHCVACPSVPFLNKQYKMQKKMTEGQAT